MEKRLQKNPETVLIGKEEGICALCERCSNYWREECLVTKPERFRSKAGIERCSHYFQEKLNLKGTKDNIWK
jgi:hypothetical protein